MKTRLIEQLKTILMAQSDSGYQLRSNIIRERSIDPEFISCYISITAPRYGSPSRGSFIGGVK